MPNTIKKWFSNNWDEMIVYGLTCWCTILSPFLPNLSTGTKIKLATDLLTMLFYLTIALFLTFVQEYIRLEKTDDIEAKNKRKSAKRKKLNLIRRFLFAMVFGFGSPAIVSKAIEHFTRLSGL